MAFYIRIDTNTSEELPTTKTDNNGELVKVEVEERIAICNRVIEKYPTYFEQGLPVGGKNGSQACNKVTSRLDVMATYILNGAKESNKECNILTDYKEKRNKTSEIPFSSIEKHQEMSKNM